MTFNKILLWSIFILPWFSLFLLKRHAIKHYMPVTVFTSLLVTLYDELAYTQKWFAVKETIMPWFIDFIPFVFGVFIVGTLWIFYLTYGHFWLYFITNIVIDGLFCFLAHNWFIKLGLIENLKHRDIHIFIAFVIISIIAYGYQVWQDEGLEKEVKK
jgi:hypothetical protein